VSLVFLEVCVQDGVKPMYRWASKFSTSSERVTSGQLRVF
jgi:hypothetical protein